MTSKLLFSHLMLLFISDALLIFTGLFAALYLYKDYALKNKTISQIFTYLPSIEDLDKINFFLLLFGLSTMSLGLITGVALAMQAWGNNWYLDPKIFWSMLTLSIFLQLFFLRIFLGFRGKKASIVTLIGVSLIIIGFSSIKMCPNSKHKNFYYEN